MLKDVNSARFAKAGIVALALGLMACSVIAGQGGDEFSAVYDTLVDWSQGTLGRIIAIAMILVGLVAGVVRQSIMAVVMGVAGCMALYNAPTVIEAIMTANPSVTATSAAFADAVKLLANGML